MVIWAALLIPLVTAAALHVWWRHRVLWWELPIPFAITFVLVATAKFVISHGLTHDVEYLTTWADRAEYWEDWSELVVKTRTVSDGKTTRTEVYTENEYHPPEWLAVDPTGRRHHLSSSEFERVARQFGNREYRPVHRAGMITKAGGVFTATWPQTDATMEVISFPHSYENRVQASPSVFKHRKIGKEEKDRYALFDYPDVKGTQQQMLLGWHHDGAERTLQVWNAKLGAAHQVRMWLLVFWEQPLDAAYAQESYWQGGNKNELVVCVGVNQDGRVLWGHVFSWTERESLKSEVKTLIENQQGSLLHATNLIDQTAALIPNGWERKRFKDFNYLSVEPPTWAVVFVMLLTLALTVATSVWAVRNEYRPDQKSVQDESVLRDLMLGVVGILTLLGALFVGLKAGGILHWLWAWAAFPFIVLAALIGIAGLIYAIEKTT